MRDEHNKQGAEEKKQDTSKKGILKSSKISSGISE
jgi:hypothetical protein